MKPVFGVTFYKLHIENNYSVRLEKEFGRYKICLLLFDGSTIDTDNTKNKLKRSSLAFLELRLYRMRI